MDTKTSMLIMAGICVLVLVIGILRRKAEIVLNFLVRTIVGAMAIFFVNLTLAELGIEGMVGINPLSLLTVGSLGTGGFALLYGIVFYHML
ncbi:MAG: transcriptional regulator [Lachnospiraceae bacterium]|nr:transcriptional regulator [Lachnospiraceae bacterium]